MKAIIRDKAELKDSGIDGVGTIPYSWEINRVHSLFDEISERYEQNIDNELPLLSVSEYYGVASRASKIKEDEILIRAETLDGYKKCKKGDIVSNIMLAWKCSLGRSPIDGIVSPAYCVYRPRKNVNSKFYHYLFRTKTYGDIFKVNSTGLIESRLRLYTPKFYVLNVPIPSFDEQNAIANYLDDRCGKIDAIIAEAKASIEEYKELKQAVIYEAVTMGLDKNVERYSTNNVWIPSVPKDIKLSRVGLHYKIILGKMVCPNKRTDEDTLEAYYCAANVHFDGISGELKKMWFSENEKNVYSVHCNDMLIVEGGAGAGGAAIVNVEPPIETYIQNSIMIVRAKDSNDNRYLRYLTEALVKRNYVDFVCNKATIPHFTKEKVSTIPYPVFSVKQRKEIADYLDDKTSKIDAMISEKQSLIEDLEAYKKSLIYEVVTGKRKVVE